LPEPFTATASGQVITILHAFVRKTQKTPKQELAKARQRLKEVKR
jgi:phage-related protein